MFLYMCNNTPASWPQNLSSLKTLMAIRSDRLVVSLISNQEHCTFLYRYAKHNWEGGIKEQTNKHGLGSAPSTRGGVCDTFVQLSVHLQAIVGVYFVWNFHKATRNTDSSLVCPVLSSFSLPPSANCVLLWTAISNRLFSSALLCLSLSSLGPTFPPPLLVSCSGPLCGFCTKTDKEILWVAPSQTEMNASHCVTMYALNVLYEFILSFLSVYSILEYQWIY